MSEGIPVVRPISIILQELARAKWERDSYDAELIYISERLASKKETLDLCLENADMLDNAGNPKLANLKRMSYRVTYFQEVAALLGDPAHRPGRRTEMTKKIIKLEQELDDTYESPLEDDFLKRFMELKKLERADDDSRAVAKEVLMVEDSDSEAETANDG
ncbi:hypothetical protein V5O48_009691 [Marasmius crinis-equi]|uniref:Uncharacterized protein n=1 Tax=Marasmius crinis-equi TaxID=585013 RepID=A0ABR3FAE6_9AGAR